MKGEAFHIKLAEKVRGDSKYLADLTSASALTPVQLGPNDNSVEATLVEIAKDNETFLDIKSIADPKGRVYFYSEKYMTHGYATILARVKGDDPCLTIAETVRDESRIYPRVTNIELFKYGLFKIGHEELEQHVARTLEWYDDIKKIVTPKGSTCLYSTRYLTEDWAVFLAKKAETPDS